MMVQWVLFFSPGGLSQDSSAPLSPRLRLDYIIQPCRDTEHRITTYVTPNPHSQGLRHGMNSSLDFSIS